MGKIIYIIKNMNEIFIHMIGQSGLWKEMVPHGLCQTAE